MKSLRKGVIVVVLLGGGSLLAQPGQTEGSDPAVKGAVTAKLSVEEMQARIATLDQETEEAVTLVVQLQIVARKEKDVIRLNCINDKLLQMKALRNIMEAALLDFAATSTADEQSFQFTKATMTAENIGTLREEAKACAGENVTYVGATVRDWSGPDLPDDPADDGLDEILDDIEAPAYASPFT